MSPATARPADRVSPHPDMQFDPLAFGMVSSLSGATPGTTGMLGVPATPLVFGVGTKPTAIPGASPQVAAFSFGLGDGPGNSLTAEPTVRPEPSRPTKLSPKPGPAAHDPALEDPLEIFGPATTVPVASSSAAALAASNAANALANKENEEIAESDLVLGMVCQRRACARLRFSSGGPFCFVFIFLFL